MQEGDNAFRELEYQALAQAKGAAGLEPSLEAMHQVFGHEGDVILTRRAAAHGHAVPHSALQANFRPLADVLCSTLHMSKWKINACCQNTFSVMTGIFRLDATDSFCCMSAACAR